MSKKRIVIELDERVIEHIEAKDLPLFMVDDICRAIENGTVLPKGHGRLIDADRLEKPMEFACMGVMAGTDAYNEPLKVIERAPTILEADNETDD